METLVSRYDFAPITKSETTEEGFLRVWCRAARVGTQLYQRSDGSQVREYRPHEEVGNPESLTTFGMKPATWGHPPVLLDSANTKLHQIGYSGSKVSFTDGFVEVCLTVTDQEAIEKIQRGDASEVSAGYKVEFDPTPGVTPDGESYDGIQRNIRVNHIAVVPRGRAGPDVRLLLDHMDAADAVAITEPIAFLEPPTQFSKPKSMATVKLDGLEIELPTDAASAVQSHLLELGRRADASDVARNELQTALDTATADLSAMLTEKEAAEGRADALEQRVAELEAQPTDTVRIDELVNQRLNTLQHLAPAFADDFHFNGITDAELYSQAYTNLTGKEPPEDADASYLRGAVDGMLSKLDSEPEDKGSEAENETKEDRADSTTALRQALSGAGTSPGNKIAQYHADLQNAWTKPLTASK